MKRLLVVVLALLVAFGLTACKKEPAVTVLNWNIGADPATIDPTLNGASDGGDVINQTFEGLVREIDGIIYPGIAESWETTNGGLTVTFHLRESNWSDGTPLTAADFIYGFKRGMDPLTASEYSWIWEYTNIVGSLEAVYEDGSLDDVGLAAPDAYTLVVTLKNPTAYFVSLMSFYHFMPIKQASVEAEGGADGAWAKNPALAVSNGPFKLTTYTVGEGLTLVKNEEYWNAEDVQLETINGKFIDDDATAYAAYQSGELDIIPTVPASEVTRLIAEDPEFYVFPLLGTYYYSFNMDDTIWGASVNLRKALNLAIDREAIVEALGAGQVPAAGFVPPGFRDNNGNDFFEEAGTYGVAVDDSQFAIAVTLFEAAAVDLDMTVQQLKDAIAKEVILYNTSAGHALVAQLVQESWFQVLGIELTLQNQEWAVFQDTRTAGNFDIARGGWLTDFMDPAGMLAIFTSGNAYNDPNFNNEAYDTLMTDAQATTDPAVHFAKLYEAQTILMESYAIVPVYHYSDLIYVKSYVKGWSRSVLGSIDLSGAYIEGKE